MEPVPVVPWAPADILRKLHTLQSLVVTGGATSDGADVDIDGVEVVAASASSTSYVSVSSSSLLFTSASCSVGRLSAMWLILRRLVLSSSAARFRILSSADNSAISLSMVWWLKNWLSWSFIVYSSHWSIFAVPLHYSPLCRTLNMLLLFSYSTESTDDCYMQT